MGELVWEIWVEGEDGKMATRFLLDDGGDRAKDGFDIIEKLFAHLNFIHKGIEDKLKDALENNELKRTKIAHELELNEPPPN
ncbi:MAG: hypothetical protein Q8Q73_18790 [Stagnimonas sp.]|nr:hypothetical protein [Stagnimonas sp.]